MKNQSGIRNYFLLVLILPIFLYSCKNGEKNEPENYVVLVSFDACRWDYPDLYDLTNFKKMGEDGVRAERVISSFPTKTFPNHYTLATGLYPDHHGIVNNTFYAPDLDLLYRIGNREMVQNPEFYGGEPIWNTAAKKGIKSASYFWVGSEAPIQGKQPDIWKFYDGDITFNARVDSILNWLQLPVEKRPRLLLLYFQEPDAISHDFGPVSEETGEKMKELDLVLKRLMDGIQALPYGDKVNIIVTADHGMGAISPERYVNIIDGLQDDWLVEVTGSNPVYLIDATDGFEDSVVNHLSSIQGVKAWRKENLPEHLHYGTNPRIPDIVVVADSSWSIGTDDDPSDYLGGAHGYDSRNTDMHNIFFAVGPAFKKGFVQPPFENVDIYPLVAHLLDLDAPETDGDFEAVKGMLK